MKGETFFVGSHVRSVFLLRFALEIDSLDSSSPVPLGPAEEEFGCCGGWQGRHRKLHGLEGDDDGDSG